MEADEGPLIFNGNGEVPCFFKPVMAGNPGDVFDPSKIPDSYVVSPMDFPQNDPALLAKTQNMTGQLRPGYVPPSPGACTQSPPGFVCGPLPVPNGSVSKCVPRMDNSDMNQLSARVLPYTVNRANGSLDNPARADPRFYLFPKSFPAAYSRCCMGKMSDPSDIKPIPCDAVWSKGVQDRLMPEQHKVDPMDLGFRSNENQLIQLKATRSQIRAIKTSRSQLTDNRDRVWRLESQNIRTWSMDEYWLWVQPKRKSLDFL
jgi:hypothetical protein